VLADCEGRAPRERPAVKLPVERHLAALGEAGAGPTGAIVRAFLACAPHADWQQNPSYTRATVGDHFVDNYGYVEFVGPGRRWDCPHLRVGVLVLGPEVAYADHAHPAEEVYHPIAGRALWWREDRDWRPVPDGEAIHHAPWVRHATRTEAEPLLALYCWGGEIGPAANLTGDRR
jgi:mannose-6-phosphate isomerase-like protein (cupin superfamily)